MCSRVAVMLSRCSLSLSLSPSSWGCQGALVCAGRPRGLVLEAFLQQTRQQASVFESSLEIVLCNSQKCPNLCASSWHFCNRIGQDNRPQYLNLLENFSFVTLWNDQIQFKKAKIMWNLLCVPAILSASALHFCNRHGQGNRLQYRKVASRSTSRLVTTHVTNWI